MEEQKNDFTVKIYGLYDTQLGEYSGIVNLKEFEMKPYFTEISSDVKSPYYGRSKNFDVIELGVLENNGNILANRIFIDNLQNFQDVKRVEYQRIIQTLNFIPSGYFKMPKEMQDVIQEQIKQAVTDYVSKYADVEAINKKLSEEHSEVNQ